MFKRVVSVVQGIALLAAVFTVVQLAVKDPPELKLAASGGGAIDGAAIYDQVCSGCHGPNGEGQYGKKLNGGAVVANFPDKAAETAIVAKGKGLMPGFASSLTPEQLDAVVEYTRTGLQQK